MKKITIMSLLILFAFSTVFGGGIVTNTNQSAEYARTLNRTASTDVDAVFSNPAGLAKLEDGFYFGLSNQSIFQTREIKNNYKGPQGYTGLNKDTFEGKTTVPIFPDVYLAYKTGKFALSGGLMIIGGGGTAEFDKGLPSFEMAPSDLVPALSDYGVAGYNLDVSFKGSSTYFGGQAGISYQINDMISVSVGGRFVSATNTYKGHLKDVQVITIAGTMAPGSYMRDFVAPQATAAAAAANAAAEQYTAAGMADSAAYYTAVAAEYAAGAVTATETAAALDVNFADQEADVKQTGTGFTPIIGINISPSDKLNIGFRYEALTKLEMENDTKKDIVLERDPVTGAPTKTMYPDKVKTHQDMPAMVALGVSYFATPQIRLESSFQYYFDKNVDWDGREEKIDNNYIEAGLALEYALNEKIKVSTGYLYAGTGVSEDYQADVSYSLSSNSVAFGGAYSVSPAIDVNFGAISTFYMEGEKSFNYESKILKDPETGVNLAFPVKDTYNKTSLLFSVGLQYKF